MSKHRVIVVGGGFAGLQLVKALRGALVSITLIDRRNHHLFQPLLYQAATAIIAPSEIAWPFRQVLRDREDVDIILGEVVAVDRDARQVVLNGSERIPFDTLVLATGASHAYFGHDDWAAVAPGLKTAADADVIRNRMLGALEQAERTEAGTDRAALMTSVVIGGGPTGVEMAGMLADLMHSSFPREFRRIDTRQARVLLVEAGPRLLGSFEEGLARSAQSVLTKKGVEVRLGTPVSRCAEGTVSIGEEIVPASLIVWAAGVQASPAARWLGIPGDRAGRAVVQADLTIPDDRDIFVIGDTASVKNADGSAVPGLAPAAKQQGEHVARTIRRRLQGAPSPGPFRYRHQGSLATIGHRAAIADFGRLKVSGYAAWWLWGLVHIFFLIGVRSRIAVATSWLWTYLKGQPTARILDENRSRA